MNVIEAEALGMEVAGMCSKHHSNDPARPLERRSSRIARRAMLAVAIALAAAVDAERAYASDPYGIYVVPTEVNVGAKDGRPEVRIHGAFALSYRPQEGDRRNHGIYTAPQRGYMFFRCPAGEDDKCRAEWADIAALVAQDACAAFGDRYATDPAPNGSVRPDDALPPADPDPYPLAMGVMRTTTGMAGTCTDLLAFARSGGGPSAPPPTGEPPTIEPPASDKPTIVAPPGTDEAPVAGAPDPLAPSYLPAAANRSAGAASSAGGPAPEDRPAPQGSWPAGAIVAVSLVLLTAIAWYRRR